jgi:2'-5' RNA ligase
VPGLSSRGAPDRHGPEPLVVTLLLDDDAQRRFDRLRAEHFPARPLPGSRPERARGGEDGVFRLAAHVTLFHALPGEHLDAVRAELGAVADREAFDVAVTGLRFLGRGVAYALDSPDLTRLRDRLAAAWEPWLTRQDRQRHAPHVTVQNKVDPAAARALHDQLLSGFAPYSVRARGLGLWRYLAGPWAPVSEHTFR